MTKLNNFLVNNILIKDISNGIDIVDKYKCYGYIMMNNYEEKIFQHEDKLYEYDTLIDNIRKSFKKVNQIFNDFMNLPEIE